MCDEASMREVPIQTVGVSECKTSGHQITSLSKYEALTDVKLDPFTPLSCNSQRKTKIKNKLIKEWKKHLDKYIYEALAEI